MTSPAKCPQCQQLVSVPAVDHPVRFQCPCCEGEFDGSTLVPVDAPPLRILSSLSADPPAAVDEFAIADSSPSPLSGETDAPMPQVTETTAPRHGATSKARASSRRSRGARMELIKIVLGGLAGIAIAQLILWWLPGDLRRDPFKVAPHLPAWLALVAPAELRQPAPFDSTIQERPAEDSGARVSMDGDNQLQLDSAPSDSTDRPAIDNIAINPENSVDLDSRDSRPNVGLRNAPSYPSGELRSLLGDIRTQLEQYDTPGIDREMRRNQLRMLYQRLCEIGEVVTFVDTSDQQLGRLMQASEALLARIAKSPEQLELVGRAAVTWMSYSSRITDGIAVTGEVIEIQPQEGLYVSTIRLHARPDVTMQLVTQLNPVTDIRQAYDVGSRILALGSIIDEPLVEIQGFQGSNEPVIWQGLHMVLSPDAPPAAG